ncbi:MAG: Gfo/Idh/MocA family oxidoreductase [Sedimentisphaerales bacterium]|nr:Gfo/Idh/MocA family oxidoreductase [Sedimentisphaerales bacterium]
MTDNPPTTAEQRPSRRRFIARSGAALFSFSLVQAHQVRGTQANSRIEIGCIGMGNRGRMLCDILAGHSGYRIAAVADYFPAVADRGGELYGVAKERRFWGLRAYQRLLASGVDAVFLETPPYCFGEHAEAAVQAGCHVYLAKPLGCDVPGCLRIQEAGRRATARKQVFLVDFQTRTDPYFIEAVQRVKEGLIGRVGLLASEYNDEGFPDPPLTDTIESRLQDLIWANDDAIGSGYFVNAAIHAIDLALWIAGDRPVSAVGASRIARRDPHGDSHDVYSLTYEFPGGLILNHRGEHLKNRSEFLCACYAQGDNGYLETHYNGRIRILANRGGYRGGEVQGLYPRGAAANIDRFHRCITEGIVDNPTIEPSVNATLAAILGRQAARTRTRVTWDQILQENHRLEVDYSGLTD